MISRATTLSLLALLGACSNTPPLAVIPPEAGTDATADAKAHDAKAYDAKSGPDGGDAAAATTVVFDLAADTTNPASFYSLPFPSDLRLNSAGAPDYSGFPGSSASSVVSGMLPLASSRKGFSSLAVGYFQFTAPMAPIDPTTVIPAGKGSSILLLDVDPASPTRGAFFPTVAWTPPADVYTAANVVTVAAEPGFVMFPSRKHAFIILREQLDAKSDKLGIAPALALLEHGMTPTGTNGTAAAALYAPLFDTLKIVGIAADDVAAATVFTTGDEVAVTATMSTALVMSYPVAVTNLSVTTTGSDAGSSYPRICELQGTVTLPQFQAGTAPFATSGGNFQLGSDGLPIKQGELAVPMAISLPTTGPMPTAGYPLVLYFHGSGGVSTEFIDRGPILTPDGGETPGQGPAYVLAPFGFAMAGAALPQNPERVPGATETEYIQVGNLSSLLGIFRQGVIEQRMFLAALASLTIDPTLVAAGCPAVSVPMGQMIHFDPASFFSQGQSMGGMYTNLITAVEPSFRAALPTGAGGFWTYFLFQSAFVPNANGLLEVALGVNNEQLNFMHPALSMTETGIEAIDPIVSAPRLSRNPLPGTNARPIYEPVGQNDSYFSNDVYNAVATAYGHKEVGSIVWPGMQTELTEDGLGGILPYPTSQDVVSGAGSPYTGVVVQYNADLITGNGHYIYAQLDTVKYQYGCFFSTVLKTGVGLVPAPAPLGTPCPLPDAGP
jgi:hypothetical protein